MAGEVRKIKVAADVALALREAEREGVPVDFESDDATYRFVPDTVAEQREPAQTPWKAWLHQPSSDDVQRRQALVKRILVKRIGRTIRPWTASDLVQAAREERPLDEHDE